MRIVFVEPPKEYWFVMGEHLPPPTACIQLAAYVEAKHKEYDITVVDCQAERLDWRGLERRLADLRPDIVAVSSLSTCNTYTVVRAMEVAKLAAPHAFTVTGGQHFTALSEPSLREYKVVDAIARGEGEETMLELAEAIESGRNLSGVRGLTFRHLDTVITNPPRPMLQNLDDLPMPGYHFVEEYLDAYHFKMMTGGKRYMILEGSRGCNHACTFCSQCAFWGNRWRSKSGKRIAKEMEYLKNRFGAEFIWLTDDNYNFGARSEEMVDELNAQGLGEDLLWFVQARVDDVVRNKDFLPAMRRSGNQWVLLGVESGDPEALAKWNKETKPGQAKEAITALEGNDIFAQATMIIGDRKDTHQSIEGLRRYVEALSPGLAIFMILTPYPGTKLYEEAAMKGWIQDTNWADYDMIHAIMPTETLSVEEVQKELFQCYRGFYGKWGRRIEGLFSGNRFKRRTYRHMASENILNGLRGLI